MFSKTSEYAIKIMIYLGTHKENEKLHGVREICEMLKSPEAFTAKILQQLVRAELLSSMKGKNGGFKIEKKTKEITIFDIVKAIDGDKSFTRCILGLADCSGENPCPLHHKYYKIKNEIQKNILNTNIKDLKDNLKHIKIH